MGLYIHHSRVMAEKQGREPTRCYRCQEYGHMAAKCTGIERCARCGGGHAGKGCTNQLRCIPCGLEGHASYSRKCPIFHRKCEEMAARLPKNRMLYYPMEEKWTHWGAPGGMVPYGQQMHLAATRQGTSSQLLFRTSMSLESLGAPPGSLELEEGYSPLRIPSPPKELRPFPLI